MINYKINDATVWTLQSGQQIIAIHILPNISRRKGNQAIKFGQIIEPNMSNFFLEKSCRN